VTASATSARGEKVAIIGVACHFPEAPSIQRYWSNLRAGRDSTRVVPSSRWDPALYYDPVPRKPGKTSCKRGAFLDEIELFDPGYFGISETLAEQTDPLQRQWLEVSMEALADAGFGRRDLWGRAVGVFAGAKAGNFYQKLAHRKKDTAVGTGQNFIAAHLAHFCNFHGPNLVVDTACASALTALHLACQSLAAGESELALAGGVDILLDHDCFVAMSAAQVLSPDGRCKTFSEDADGIGIGEGCGVLVLRPLHKALAEGNKIYAVIDSTAVNNDGHTMGITTPNPQMQRALIETALRKAQVDPRSITYCEAHGTGTLIGDPIELQALTEIFARGTASRQYCGVGSAKTNIGHLLNASGVAGLIKVLLSISHRELPPSLHCQTPNPRFRFAESPFYVVRSLQRWDGVDGVHRAGVSSFGFGGHNAHVIVSDQDVPQDRRADLSPRADMPVFNRRRFWPEPAVGAPPRDRAAPHFEEDDALDFLQSRLPPS
jgi:acyl transferase domain-containing protein